MRVLFILKAFPFPPKQGIDLPISQIIKALARHHTVDILIVSKNKAETEAASSERLVQKALVPEAVGQILNIQAGQCTRAKRVLGELMLQQPAYFSRGFSAETIQAVWAAAGQRTYDVAWVSPISGLGLLAQCQQMGICLARQIALGYNDVVTTTYFDSLRELLSGYVVRDWQRLLQGIRTPRIWWHERRYFQRVEFVHLQTPLEVARANAVLKGIKSRPVLLAAQNGRKTELEKVVYEAPNSSKVLFMTHLTGGRAKESAWFLQQVWPLILQQHPTAELMIAGKPPDENGAIARSLPPSVRVLGYVDNLVELYGSVRLAVVPIAHSTGLINRALDAITAGVPLVATSRVLSTIAGCEPGRDAITADTATDFANAVCSLLGNNTLSQTYSAAGRALAKQQPTWQESTEAIIAGLEKIAAKSMASLNDSCEPSSYSAVSDLTA